MDGVWSPLTAASRRCVNSPLLCVDLRVFFKAAVTCEERRALACVKAGRDCVCSCPWPDCVLIYSLALLNGFGLGLVCRAAQPDILMGVMSPLLQCSSSPRLRARRNKGWRPHLAVICGVFERSRHLNGCWTHTMRDNSFSAHVLLHACVCVFDFEIGS